MYMNMHGSKDQPQSVQSLCFVQARGRIKTIIVCYMKINYKWKIIHQGNFTLHVTPVIYFRENRQFMQ